MIVFRVYPDKGEKLGASEESTRSSVVSTIEDDKSFVTITRTSEGKWRKGEDVHIIKVKDKKYIRTDANEKESDNLGDLPRF